VAIVKEVIVHGEFMLVSRVPIFIVCFLYISTFFVCSYVLIDDVFPCLLVAGDSDD
jgi:hypothetical protein